MASHDLALRALGANSPLAPRNGKAAQQLAAEAGLQMLASDLNAVAAKRDLNNAETFIQDRVRADSRIAAEAEARSDGRTASVLLSDTCADYQQITRAITHRRFLR